MKRILSSFMRYCIVGVINTALDYLILNILMYGTDIYKGFNLVYLNSFSWGLASINSYFMNKRWTFKDHSKDFDLSKILRFSIVIFIAYLINSFAIVALTSIPSPSLGFSSIVWANVAKTVATLLSLLWSFTCLKFLIFSPND